MIIEKIGYKNYLDLLEKYPLEELKNEVKRRVVKIHKYLVDNPKKDLTKEEFMELIDLGIVDMNLEVLEKKGRLMQVEDVIEMCEGIKR